MTWFKLNRNAAASATKWMAISCLALLAFGGLPTTAQSQSERELLQQARREMERGQELYLQERWTDAADAFMAAYAAKPFSAFLYNAGIAHEKNGDAAKAVEFYERYLEDEPDASDAEEVRERVERLRAILNPSTPEGGTPEGTPEGGTPEGGSETTGETGSTGETETGTTTTENGSQTGTETGSTATLVAAPPRPMKSLLSVETVPDDATITIRQGQTVIGEGASPYAHTLDEGEYEISVSHPDYQTISRSMQVRPGKVYVAILEMSQGEFLGYMRVVTDPPGANIYIDDREEGAVGQTPFQNVIATGTHHIWIERPGYGTEERDIEIMLGGDVTQEVQLTRLTYGRIRVVGNVPAAKVLVDGEEVGEVPYEGDVEAGPHTVTVRYDGMKDWEETVDVQRGQLTPIRVRLRPAVARGGAWATAAFAVLFVAGGVVTRVMAGNELSALEADRNAGILASEDSRRDFGFGLSIGSLAAFGIGGILGLLSIYYFVRDPLPDSEGNILEPRDWTLMPMVDPVHRAGGVDMRWRF